MSSSGRLERIKMHLADAKSREVYSIQRIDLLIISVSGAGVYLVFETLKFLYTQQLAVDRLLLMAGGVAFVLAIMFNFASQWNGYFTNKYEACWAMFEHKRLNDEPMTADEDKEQARYNRLAVVHSKWVRGLNITSTALMVAGVVLLALFNLLYVPAAA